MYQGCSNIGNSHVHGEILAMRLFFLSRFGFVPLSFKDLLFFNALFFAFIYSATNSEVGQAILGYMALEAPRISGYIAKIFWLYSQGFLICAVDCESSHVL